MMIVKMRGLNLVQTVKVLVIRVAMLLKVLILKVTLERKSVNDLSLPQMKNLQRKDPKKI